MNALLTYLFKVLLVSGALYGFYRMLFVNRTSFGLNRTLLFLSMILSPLLPLISLEMSKQDQKLPVYLLQDVVIGPINNVPVAYGSLVTYISVIYCIISLFFICRIITGAISISRIYFKGEKMLRPSVKIIISDENIRPFSLFNMIFIPRKAWNDPACSQIILHEETHVKQRHSIDVFVSEILCALFWVIPFMWKFKSSLKLTHEFLADEKIKERSPGLTDYFNLLVADAGVNLFFAANHFNKSFTLKRIKMMKKNPTPSVSRWLYLTVLPLLAVIFLTVSCSYGDKNPSEANNGKDISDQTSDNTTQEGKTVFETADVMPVFGKTEKDLAAYLSKEIKYPEEAKEKGIQGKVFVTFTVNESGNISDAFISKPANPILDAEALRVVNKMPAWQPGKIKGKAVKVKITLPVNFKLN